ncbi:hypothetical protein V6N13_076640 [Hibiscus sabdariffa]|uniref:Uncharacterized protein n=2 Tax=Hibiscus sabdariffa TaxID=183260 RepID=A0ABR2NPG6_9ROSI
MFDFGDEVGYRIPWLIWIQTLVLLLLIILLYCLALFVLDLPEISSSSCPDFQLGITPVLNQTTALASQDGEKQSLKGEIGRGRGRRWKKQANDKGPCHYLRLVKLAFLKCLGLDFLCSDSDTSSQR